MNKVVTIHLDGIAYQLEEAAYDSLRAYLDQAGAKLVANPDKDEILKDLEQAIGAKLNAYLTAHKNVVTAADVAIVIKEMGPVSAEGEGADSDGSSQKSESVPPHKKLYRITSNEWIAGVCSGLAAYFNIDVTLMRILFVLLTILTHGLGVLIYIVMVLIVPVARTQKDYQEASGVPPVTAQELVDRARKSVEDFANSGEWQSWRNNLKDNLKDMHQSHLASKQQGRQWKRAQKAQWKAQWKGEARRMQYEHHSSPVSELFGIACATLAISFVLWFLYGHVTIAHQFFDALHAAYKSFIYSLAGLLDNR